MNSKKLLFTCITILVIMLTSCINQPEQKTAQIPSFISISEDVFTIINKEISISVNAEVSDSGYLSYQWYSANDKLSKGTLIDNANSYTYIPETKMTGNFYYYCVIKNTLGDSSRSVESPRILVSISENQNAKLPNILLQPQNYSGSFDEAYSFSCLAISPDDGELTYQWYYSIDNETYGEVIENATDAQLSGIIDNSSLGYYYCVITNLIEDNGDGGKKSAQIKTNTVLLSNDLVVANIPMIISQPESCTAVIPATRVFSVGAYSIDEGQLSFQWHSVSEDGEIDTVIEGANSSTYKVTANEIGKIGYYCVITNAIEDNGDGGKKTATTSTDTAYFDAVYLKGVVSAPTFTIQPSKMNIAPYNQGVSLVCEAESPDYEVSYKWYQSLDGTTENGFSITKGTGINTPNLTTQIFTEKGIYYFYCVATNILPIENEDIKSAAVISEIVSVAYTGLPTLYLNTYDVETSEITKDDYCFGDFKLISEDYGIINYTFSKEKNGEKKEGIKGRGNTSWSMPKKGYSIKFDSKQSFFGLPSAKKWCIIANYSDKTLLRNKLASYIGNEVLDSEWAPTFNSVDVIMNDEYMGNYIFCERNTLSTGRVDVQDISDVDEKLAEGKDSKIIDANSDGEKNLYDGGFLIEVEANETRAKDNDFYFNGTKGGRLFCLKDPDKVSSEVKEVVQSIVLNAENVLYSDGYTDADTGWRKYIDENSVIDWYLINEFAKTNDSIFFSSVYMYYNPEDEKLHMGPIWDFDISFGNVNYNDCDLAEGFWLKKAIWISRMFTDSEFVENVKKRWNEKKLDLYSVINSNLEDLESQIEVSAEYNFERWKILGTYVWPNADGYITRTTYKSEITYLQEWLNQRYSWFDTAINGL